MALTNRRRFPVLLILIAALALFLAGAPARAQEGSAPDAPTGLIVASVSHDAIELDWDDSGDSSITHYQVFRRDRAVHEAGEFVTIEGDTGSTATEYTDATVKADNEYVYRVKAVNAHGASPWSDHVRADTPSDGAVRRTARGNAPYVRSPADDIDTLDMAENNHPYSIWSNGTTMWVADWDDDKLYAYTLATGARDTSKEFDLHHANDEPIGIWSDGVTMWVADWGINRIYAYTLATGAQDTSKTTVVLDRANTNPAGIWSDGITMWVADDSDDKLYAYTLGTEARDSDKDIDLAVGNDVAFGIWSDGATMWVADWVTKKLFAYALATGDRDASRDFTTLDAAENHKPAGIWSDGAIMWVSDTDDSKLYAYNMPDSKNANLSTLTMDSESVAGFDLDRTSYNFGVAAPVASATVHGVAQDPNATLRYSPDDADGSAPGHQVYLSEGQDRKNVFVTVTAEDGITIKTYAVTILRGSDAPYGWRAADDLYALASGNDRPEGIWSDGITMWVLDGVDRKLYAYTLATGARDTSKEFNVYSVKVPVGIWSDGITMWVSYRGTQKLHAYALATGARDTSKEFNLDPSNDPFGIWSDGTTMWVAAPHDYKLYAYTLATGARDASKEFTASGAYIWSDGTTMWTTGTGGLSAYTLATGARDANKDFRRLHDLNRFRYGIWSDGTTMWVASSGRVYSYNMPGPSNLSALTVDGESVAALDPDRTSYQFGVAASVARVTVQGVAQHADSALDYSPDDADGSTPGHQVYLSEGRNVVTVTVTAKDGITTRDYTVSVNQGSDAAYGWRAADDIDTLAAAGNNVLGGIWSDGITMWVLDADKIYAYTLVTGARDTSKEFDLHPANDNPIGIWSDGTTMWVADYDDDKLYAYTLATGARDSGKDIDTLAAAENNWPDQIWSDGTTMWVADLSDLKLYAYTLATGARDASRDFDTLVAAGNTGLGGIWSDGITMWVADWGQYKIYAYTLATGARDASRDFDTLVAAGNTGLRGIWSDGTTMWVADYDDDKLYAYNMPGDAYLSALGLSHGTLTPTFDSGTTVYMASVEHSVSQITVTATASDADNATLAYLDADGNTAGQQVGLTVGKNVIKVKVTAADHVTNQTYTLTVTRAEAATAPDLVVDPPTVTDSNPAAGTSFTLNATVRNRGNGAAAGSTLTYYHSSDATIDTSDTSVGTDSVSSLSAGASSAQSISVTAPVTTGTYYYGACVGTVTNESATGNNCSTAVRVTVVGPPDLVVGTPTVSDSSPLTGASFTLRATVRNQGGSTAGSSTLRYYRSTIATIATSDTSVGTDSVSSLSAGASSSESITVTAPVTAGTYYYGACVGTVTNESDTANNCSAAVTVTVTAPDLVVESPSVSAGRPLTGATFTLSATVRNQGNAAAGSTTLRYYRSIDSTISSSDTPAGTDSVSSLGPGNTSAESISLAAPTSAGTYYYGACVGTVTNESDTTNNCSAAVTLTVVTPPDLVVDPPTVSDSNPAAGTALTLRATVRNQGGSTAGSTTLRYYRSTNTTIDTNDSSVGTDTVSSLSAGASSPESTSVTAPATAGTYYYGACVGRVTNESDTTNNCSVAVAVTVGAAPAPDLVVEAPMVNSSSQLAGASFTLSAKVRNQGSAASDSTTLTYYRSTNATIATSDTAVGTNVVIGLPAGRTAALGINLTAPATAGTYYYGACVGTVTNESDTANNCSAAVRVTVGAAPVFSEGADTERSVVENSAAGTNVGSAVRATDADNDTLTYSLEGTDEASFSIVSDRGQIQTSADLDHEARSRYSVTVRADDGKGGTATIEVIITVTDVNEPPVVTNDEATTVEDMPVEIEVLLNDSDPEQDRSELLLTVVTSPLKGRVTVNEPANAGENRTITYKPNDDYNGSDTFTYRVRDTGNPSLSSTATVSLQVDAVNDAPEFRQSMPARSVAESAQAGDNVGTPVTATDVDENDTLTYSLSGADASFFEIDQQSGQITVGDAAAFDIATQDTYTVTVEADDRIERATVEVTITVTTRLIPPPPPRRGGGGGGGSSSRATPTPTPTPSPTPTPTGPQFSGVIAAGPRVTATVVPEGTTLGVNGGGDLPGGVYVNFPPTAVALPVQVSISVSNAAPSDVEAPSGTTLLPLTINITPETPLTLGTPLTIEINPTPEQLEAAGGDLNHLAVGVVTPNGIVVLPTQVMHGRLVVTIDHLSTFVLVAITDPGPVLRQPPMGDASSMGPLLQWTQPPQTTWFQVQVIPFNEDGPGINLVIGDSAQVRAAQYQVMAPNFGSADPNYVLLPDMTYLWRVRTSTVLTNPTEADWSAWAASSFRTPPASSSTITRVAPALFGEVSTLTPTLTWANSNPAVFYYEVQLSRDFEFGPNAFLYSEYVHGGASTPPNSYVVPEAFPLEAGAIYYWRVRPRIQGNGDPLPWSRINVFQTPG